MNLRGKFRFVKGKLLKWAVVHLPEHWLCVLVYYTLLDQAFLREQTSVFAARKAHLANMNGVDAHRYTLRRNIHRLEKALIMRPRRKMFALDYIGETIASYESVIVVDSSVECRLGEVKWYCDVLSEYFDAIDVDSVTERLRSRFTQANEVIGMGGTGQRSVPYRRETLPDTGVSYPDFMKLLARRRSTRWFQKRVVERHLVDKAIVAALQAPSACNRQPFEFFVIDSEADVGRVASIPTGTRGYADNIPVLVVIIGRLDAYFDERDRHLIYIDGALAAMNMMTALETLGLASCPINWPDIEDRERIMAKELDLAAWQRPVMLIGVGYPDPTGGIPYSEKTPLEVVRKYHELSAR
jgi:nitroreductase